MKRIPIAIEWDVSTQRYRWAFPWLTGDDVTPYRKWDGHCCLISDGRLWKRHKLVLGEEAPAGWICSQGRFGWRPVEVSPDPDWLEVLLAVEDPGHDGGTFELCGPGIRGNPEGFSVRVLIMHDSAPLDIPSNPTDVVSWLASQPIEGIVWHGTDGRMAKLTHSTIGSQRPAAPAEGR